jgi:ribosome-binding protein aMBF1 (putative translation factor)
MNTLKGISKEMNKKGPGWSARYEPTRTTGCKDCATAGSRQQQAAAGSSRQQQMAAGRKQAAAGSSRQYEAAADNSR